MKSFKYIVGFCLLLIFSNSSALNAPGLKEVNLFTFPSSSGLKTIVEYIDKAQDSIDMTIYHLTNDEVISALIQARSRGVEVTVLMDNKSTEQPKYQLVFEKLKNAKINVIKSSRRFTITHMKAFVVDKKTAIILTINLSTRGLKIMRGFGIATQNKGIVQEMLRVFDADLDNAEKNTGLTPRLNNPNLLWSPVNSLPKLLDLIDSSQSNIRLYVENLGHAEIISSLIKAVSRGVKVRVLVPLCDFHPNPFWNIKYLNMLNQGGVDGQVMPPPASEDLPYIHAKMIMVDDRLVYLGSINFSFNSISKARELGVLLADNLALKSISEIYEHDWLLSRPVPNDLTTVECPSVNSDEEFTDN